jgi:hypothetical protein
VIHNLKQLERPVLCLIQQSGDQSCARYIAVQLAERMDLSEVFDQLLIDLEQLQQSRSIHGVRCVTNHQALMLRKRAKRAQRFSTDTANARR